MSQAIIITQEDILDQVKLYCQIPEIIKGIVTRKIIASAADEAINNTFKMKQLCLTNSQRNS